MFSITVAAGAFEPNVVGELPRLGRHRWILDLGSAAFLAMLGGKGLVKLIPIEVIVRNDHARPGRPQPSQRRTRVIKS